MRRLTLSLCLLAACSDDHIAGLAAELELPARLDLGQGYVGDSREVGLPLRASRRGDVVVHNVTSGSAAITAPVALRVPGARTELLPVTWQLESVGPFASTLSLSAWVSPPGNDGARVERAYVVELVGEVLAIPECVSSDSCAEASFDRGLGRCVETPLDDGEPCDDASVCTTDDVCLAGACIGVGISCPEGIGGCVASVCDAATGCGFALDPLRCDDDEPCTNDVCHPDGACSHAEAEDGSVCEPLTCAGIGLCSDGECQTFALPISCNDGNPCTTDTCLEDGTCLSVPGNDGDVCAAQSCLARRTCDGGWCVPELLPRAERCSGQVEQIAAGMSHTCVLVEGGDVLCFGLNDYGQLGRRSRPHRSSTSAPASSRPDRRWAGLDLRPLHYRRRQMLGPGDRPRVGSNLVRFAPPR